MLDKINVLGIVREHLSTFRSFGSQQAAPADFLLFLLLPLLVATGLMLGGAALPATAIGIIATALSVFASLFFSLLILVVDLAVRNEDRPDRQSGRRGRVEGRLIQELHANVAFAILVSLAALAALVGLSLEGSLPGRTVLEGVAFYLCTQFFMTLLMILKRAAALIGSIVKDSHRKAS